MEKKRGKKLEKAYEDAGKALQELFFVKRKSCKKS
jgi:hypothetical protein